MPSVICFNLSEILNKKKALTLALFSDLWWYIPATRYEIAIMIILENYRDKTNFAGNSIEIAKCFTIKISRYF